MKVQVCFLNPPFRAHRCCTFSETARSQCSTTIFSAASESSKNLYLGGHPFLRDTFLCTRDKIVFSHSGCTLNSFVEVVVPFKQVIKHLLIFFFKTSVVISVASFIKAAIFLEADSAISTNITFLWEVQNFI